MTIQQKQIVAVSQAVSDALTKMGLENIRRSEFFGMKQLVEQDHALAA